MGTITSTRRTYKDTLSTTDCLCLRIVRTDGTIYRFTDAVSDLTMTQYNNAGTLTALGAPVTYTSAYGFSSSAFGQTTGKAGDIDVDAFFGTSGITREDIIDGLFHRARWYLFWTNWSSAVEDDEKISSGWFGEVTMTGSRYSLKFNTLLDALTLDTGRTDSMLCNAKLGSTRCGIDLTLPSWSALTTYRTSEGDAQITFARVKPTSQNYFSYRCTTAGTSGASEPMWNTTIGNTTTDGTVVWTTMHALQLDSIGITASGGTNRTITFDSSLPSGLSDKYTNGYVEFLNGSNAGVKKRIVANSLTTLTLDTATRYTTGASDTIRITAGCQKRFETDCRAVYFNWKNFRGKPFLPGEQNVFQVVGS